MRSMVASFSALLIINGGIIAPAQAQTTRVQPHAPPIAVPRTVPKPVATTVPAPSPGLFVRHDEPAGRTSQLDSSGAPARFRGVSDASVILNAVPLGVPLATLRSLGRPWYVARQSGDTYWTYSVDEGRGWVTYTVRDGRITSTQVFGAPHADTILRFGFATLNRQNALITPHRPSAMHETLLENQRLPNGERQFIGRDQYGVLTRVVRTLGDTTLPLFVRWYEQSGWSPDRAVPSSAYGTRGERAYIAHMASPAFRCSGGNVWKPGTATPMTYGGVQIHRVALQCGRTNYRSTIYLSASDRVPHGFDEDPIAQRMLFGSTSSPIAAPLASAQRPGTAAAASLPGTTTGQVGKLWFTTPNGRRCNPNVVNDCDILLGYVDDPAHPLQSITISNGNGPQTLAVPVSHLSTTRSTTIRIPAQTSMPCSFGNNSGKCPSPSAGANPCPTASGNYGTYSVTTGTMCQSEPSDPSQQPRDRSAHDCGGGPVDFVSGKLWFAQPDFALSGPFGLSVSHRYDSNFAQYQGDLGIGWRESYGAYLDLSGIATFGNVVYHTANCSSVTFPAYGSTGKAYDQYSGDHLIANTDGTFTITMWDASVQRFDAQGRLSSVADRIGNVQTIARDATGRISTVTDSLGRTLVYAYDTKNRILSVTSNPTGASVTFTYDSGTNCFTGDLCSAKQGDGATWHYQYYDSTQFGGNHLLEYVIDPLNHISEYNKYQLIDYGDGNAHYRVTHQEQQAGLNAFDVTYALNGTTGTTTVSDALGANHATTYTWDELLQEPLTISGYQCHCGGNQLSYTYDQFGRRLTSIEGTDVTRSQMYYGRDVVFTSPDGTTTYSSIAYPGATEIDEPNIRTSNGDLTRKVGYSYYPIGDSRQDLPATSTEPSVDTAGNAVTTSYTYSTTGLLTKVARQGYVAGISATHSISFIYDTKGRMQSRTGPRTDVIQTTKYAYYPDTDTDLARRGQLDTVTDALSHVTTYANGPSPYGSYTVFGGAGSVTDANGVLTERGYDKRGRLLTSQMMGVTGDTANLLTTLSYDGDGNLQKLGLPLGNAVRVLHDGANNVTNAILLDASGYAHDQAVVGYDVMSQRKATTYQSCPTPAATCASWSTQYSDTENSTSVGNPATTTFTDGATSTRTWDKYGDPTGVQSADATFSVSTGLGYDGAHDLASLQLNSTGYDSATLVYDLQHNLAAYTPSNSNTTVYAYDDFGNLTSESSPISGTTTYGYDAARNVIRRTDANGSVTTYTYDALDRPLTSSSAQSGKSTESVAWTYDSTTSGSFGIGRLAKMTDPSGSTTYTYERRGKPASVTRVIGSATYGTTYAYDGNGNRRTVTLPSARTLTYTYDYADRPASVKSSTTTYVSAATYLPFGPLTSLSFGNGTTQTRSYSKRYLPAEIKLVNGTATLSDVSYTENGPGYITAATDNLNAAYTRRYSYGGNAGNMLTEADTGSTLWTIAQYTDTYADNLGSQNIPHHNYGFTYDSNPQLMSVFNSDTNSSYAVAHDPVGNQTAFGTHTYSYTSRGLLGSGDGIAYAYDGFGQRVSSTLSSQTRESLYDIDRHLQSESALSSTSIAYDYIWFGSLPVAQEDVGGSTHWTATDALGAPFLQTTATGALYWQADYEPFGGVYSLRTSDVHQPLRYPGQEAEEFNLTDGPNGHGLLFYNGARWYQPSVARYTQPDPVGFEANAFNLYAYAFNNPVAYNDPSGTTAIPLLPGAVGIGVFAPEAAVAVAAVVIGAGIVVAAGVGLGDLAYDAYHSGAGQRALGNGGAVSQGAPGATAPSDASRATTSMPPPPDDCGPSGQGGQPHSEDQPSDRSGLGDLTNDEVARIQNVVDRAGRPLDVVGSAARGTRAAGSDIDYTTVNANHGNYADVLEDLPEIDTDHWLLRGNADPSDGPAIRFEPGNLPLFIPGH